MGPTTRPYDINKEKAEEVKCVPKEVRCQSYITNEGYKVLVKPVVTKVIKYNLYNKYGEPIYSATIQPITNIEKFISKIKDMDE
jgi:hypothetical protein